MSYRRQPDDLDQWRRSNAELLISLGLPEVVVTNHRRFILAIQNAEDTESGWSVEWIAHHDVKALLVLLSQKFDDMGWNLVEELHRKYNHA